MCESSMVLKHQDGERVVSCLCGWPGVKHESYASSQAAHEQHKDAA